MRSLLAPLSLRSFFDYEDPTDYLSKYDVSIPIHKEDNKMFVSFDLPGMKKEDVKIWVEDKTLYIDAERKDHKKQRFYEQVRMPKSVDVSTAKSKLEDGVLKVYFDGTKEKVLNKKEVLVE